MNNEIKLVFSNFGGIISSIIAWFTWSKWSHVEILLPDGRTLLGAQANGVSRRPFLKIKTKPYEVCRVDVSPEILDKALKYAEGQEGKKYDYTAILGFVFRRKWQKTNRWFCSELVAWSFKQAGMPLVSEKAWKISPQDLYQSVLVVPNKYS